MESIIERIKQHKFWPFHGGIHPPEQKSQTTNKPIRQLPLPKQLILPLQQHIGRQGDLLVKVGDHVLKGQALTRSSNPMAVPIHAPTSGIISAIEKSVIAHPSGLSELCIFLDVDFEDKWRPRNICQNVSSLSCQEIISKIADAGIAGMGGAGFPTHIKVNTKPEIDFLIINAAECEPYITADDLLMCEQSEAIVDGIKILDKLLNPAFILIGIEDNKPKAIKALEAATKHIEKITVCVLPTKYPTGGEKQLIKILTGKEVKSGSLPINSGIVVQNVATCFAISDAVIHDIPLIKRVVTLAGQALSKPQNVWALLGTPVGFLLEQTGFIAEESSISTPAVIMGGPLMGFNILNESVPIVKTSNCILAPSKVEMPSAFDNNSQEVECIRCGQCADVCPSQLLPQELQWSAKAKDHPQLKALNIFDCIDCGACAYVCPSQIPLVQYYRVAKAEIRQQQQLDIKAEKAKVRFEARKLRLEKEKIAREEKHKKAAAARKATMNKKSADGSSASSAVAAALARVKAKKLANEKGDTQSASTDEAPLTTETHSNSNDDDKSQVKAAIARAKAKRLAKSKATNNEVVKENTLSVNSDSAEKLEKELPQDNTTAEITNTTTTANNGSTEQTDKADTSDNAELKAIDKKARIAATIEKAKAKAIAKTKAKTKPIEKSNRAKEESVTKESEELKPKESVKTSDVDDKKARIAAAVEKAKAKAKASKRTKAPEQISEDTGSKEEVITTTEQSDDKKARVAAAIAKAKAKALAKKKQTAEVSAPINDKHPL